jgi:hypothetical protein
MPDKWMDGLRRGADNDLSKHIVEMMKAAEPAGAAPGLVRWLKRSTDPKNSRAFFATASPGLSKSFKSNLEEQQLTVQTEPGNFPNFYAQQVITP